MSGFNSLRIPYTLLYGVNPSVVFGNLAIADDDTYGGLYIDRSVPGGLNYQEDAFDMDLLLQYSVDAGASWVGGSTNTTGGAYPDTSSPLLQTATGLEQTPIPLGTGRLARVTISIPGVVPREAAVGIAGCIYSSDTSHSV
jgi:hypothetical protein